MFRKLIDKLPLESRVFKIAICIGIILIGALIPTVVYESGHTRATKDGWPNYGFLGEPTWQALVETFTGKKAVMGATNLRTYPSHSVFATIFWLGEGATAENAYITNVETAWDKDAIKSFGGVDDPSKRTADGMPQFTPSYNPFYFALPAMEFDDSGVIVAARQRSYWHDQRISDDRSLFKGRWIMVKSVDTNKVIYAQWVDVGPNQERDYEYVFGDGSVQPKNTFGLKAGLDLSPAAAINLGIDSKVGGADVTWQFVNDADVPDGLWKRYAPIDNAVNW